MATGKDVVVTEDALWWRSAVIYQVYIRSFKDASGDGLGDIGGVRSKLSHLAELGIDALWINPWYPSPMADGGYDVADYRAVEPRFGTVAEAETLIRETHALGLRVLLDIVPNHTSDAHPWFVEALASPPDAPARLRYYFRPGRGRHGDEPPNNWQSQFGGPAWTRTVDADGFPGEWFLHLFAPAQPDLDWQHPEVNADFEKTLRFWFDRGVDGFRIDVAHALVKAPGLPDVRQDVSAAGPSEPGESPYFDRDEVHDVYRRWRTLADGYQPKRVFVAEAWVSDPARLARYVRPDELHTAFNFEFLVASWEALDMRATIDSTIASLDAVGAPATWVLSNHDVVRHVSRFGRRGLSHGARDLVEMCDVEVDLDLGTRRARAALLLMLALPGGAYIYQGEELGLAEVEDLPLSVLQDPKALRSGGSDPGRDGCRVPIPWNASAPPFGFRDDGVASTWLPQPSDWEHYTVERESLEPESMLDLYRRALASRRLLPALGDGSLAWIEGPTGSLSFGRDPNFACVVNLDANPFLLPEHRSIILTSAPLDAGGLLARDTAVWLEID